VLFTESLDIRFAVRIEKLLAALLPRRPEFWRCDVPVRAAFLRDSTQVPSKILQSRSTKKPVAVVALVCARMQALTWGKLRTTVDER
jgi:hypothetical protein